jgi:hypothetical protein
MPDFLDIVKTVAAIVMATCAVIALSRRKRESG